MLDVFCIILLKQCSLTFSLFIYNTFYLLFHYSITGNPQIASVVAGVHDINDVSAQIRYVTEVVIHPEYNYIFNADIALLKMELPFNFNKNVQQICLPWDGRNFSLSSRCFIAGWGVSDMTGIN